MPQRDAGQDGGVGRAAFAIRWPWPARVLPDGSWGPKARAADRTRDLSGPALPDSIWAQEAVAAFRTKAEFSSDGGRLSLSRLLSVDRLKEQFSGFVRELPSRIDDRGRDVPMFPPHRVYLVKRQY